MNLFLSGSLSTLCLVLTFLAFATALPEWQVAQDGREYLIDSDLKYTWYEANHECAQRGLQLAEIASAEKSAGFEALLRTLFKNSPDLWIGANDLTEGITKDGINRPFYWAHRKKPFTFTYWAPRQPDNLGGLEHCVQVYSAGDFKWNDDVCNGRKVGYVCETRFVGAQ